MSSGKKNSEKYLLWIGHDRCCCCCCCCATNHLLVNSFFPHSFRLFEAPYCEFSLPNSNKKRVKRTTLKHLIMNNVHIISIEQKKSAPIWFWTFFSEFFFAVFFLPLSLWCMAFFFLPTCARWWVSERTGVCVCAFQLVFVHSLVHIESLNCNQPFKPQSC